MFRFIRLAVKETLSHRTIAALGELDINHAQTWSSSECMWVSNSSVNLFSDVAYSFNRVRRNDLSRVNVKILYLFIF